MDFGGGDEIRFERMGEAGVVTLTRPDALNALTHRMVKALSRALAAWADDRTVAWSSSRPRAGRSRPAATSLAVYEGRRRATRRSSSSPTNTG